MRDFPAFRSTAIRYWERRRIVYNLALMFPAWFGYRVTEMFNSQNEHYQTDYTFALPRFLVAAVGANICYSFCYALEFLSGSDDPASGWLRGGRTTAFVLGVLFAMVLAFIGGGQIATMEWHHGLGGSRLK